jgi:AraC family transcriptional activator FtrA
MSKVAILIYDEVSLFELGCAVELFGLPRPEFQDWYECGIVSFSQPPLNSTAGIGLIGKHIRSLAPYDILIIPSWPTDAAEVPEPMAEEIGKFYRAEKRILSFCSGAFLLAQLGLLNGRRATTHWRYAEIFKQRFPEVCFSDDVLYIYDGQLGCSAGSSAAIDLGLEVIRKDFGYRIANSVARRLVLSAHRKGGQTQYAETPVPRMDSPFAKALDWALKNIDGHIDIFKFAQQANMSRRTFDRKFRMNLGVSPKEWLTHQRLNRARELLENFEYSVEKVAELSGFETAATMRHHFRKALGISPSLHRERFNPQFSGTTSNA